MKPIENILRNANEENLARSLPIIQAQIDYFRVHHVGVNGISLITVLDLLDVKYNREVLRKEGYTLTLEDFQNDAQKFLRLSQDNPIIYNAQLKRLFRSYAVFKDKYVKGLVFNQSVTKEMTQKFTDALLASYLELNNAVLGMPKSLSDRVLKSLETEAAKFSEGWLAGKFDSEAAREFSSVLSDRLLKLSEHDGLPVSIAKQLAAEKKQINDVNALQNYFHDKNLPDGAMVKIFSQIIGDITADMHSGKLTVNSALGALIAKRRDGTFQAGEYNFISPILKDWQNNKVSADVAAELEKYIANVIETLREDLIESLEDKFSQMAVRNFLERLRKNSFDATVNDEMKKFTAEVARDVLVVQGPTQRDDVKECVKLINLQALTVLHDDWIQGRFTNEENTFVSAKVFESLDEIAHKIQMNIWVNQASSDNANLQLEIAKLKREKSDLTTRFEQLTAVVTQLSDTVAKMAGSQVVVQEAASEPAKQPVGESASPSFFKK